MPRRRKTKTPRRKTSICVNCGKKFVSKTVSAVYCSEECRHQKEKQRATTRFPFSKRQIRTAIHFYERDLRSKSNTLLLWEMVKTIKKFEVIEKLFTERGITFETVTEITGANSKKIDDESLSYISFTKKWKMSELQKILMNRDMPIILKKQIKYLQSFNASPEQIVSKLTDGKCNDFGWGLRLISLANSEGGKNVYSKKV